ncbi:MAG: ATP-dependent helicase [Clostridiales bacterium]|jgi:DNA helicase-2/ATP-dependent DNA helicase PcrA|nr:ATP-dependent helicase [Clostridiales bacterium]
MIPLNENQMTASRHGDGPMMVLAGPGSGKTTVIIHRVYHLINELHIEPGRIMVITFTKSATEEMRRRFINLAGAVGSRVMFSTFHALFYKIIRYHYRLSPQNILTDKERQDALKKILHSFSLETDTEFMQSVINEIARVKNDLINLEFYNSSLLSSEDFKNVYTAYENYKYERGSLDFDDMLARCYEVLTKYPATLKMWKDKYPYILVDEFQDINHAQYKCISMLAGSKQNLFIVGDDDQSIYRFRGARPEFLLRFPSDFPKTAKTVLNTNYRSTEQIIGLCNNVICRNSQRYSKVTSGIGRKGNPPRLIKAEDVNSEADAVALRIKSLLRKYPPEEIAVVYRTNIQSRAIVDAFLNSHIPYKIKDEIPSIYEHWIAKDIYSYLRLTYDRKIDDYYLRIINKPSRYISNAAIASARRFGGNLLNNLYNQKQLKVWQISRLEDLSRSLHEMSKLKPSEAIKYLRHNVGYNTYLKEYADYRKMDPVGLYEALDELQEAAKPFDGNEDFINHIDRALEEALTQKSVRKAEDNHDRVLLSTMHSAKGLEFGAVFVVGAVEGSIPYEKSKTDAEIEEERRLFYVAITRAKTELYISVVKKRYEQAVKPTRFLEGIF